MPERIPVRATRNGGIDYIEVATPEEAHVAALRRERAGYLAYGKTDRAEQVAAELARLGAPVEAAPAVGEGPVEDTAERTPRQRAVTRRRK